jgi:hypothetical protein
VTSDLPVPTFTENVKVGQPPLLFFALMLIKLKLERLLRVRNPLDGGHRNLELTIAKSADSDSGDGSEPLEHPKSPLFNSQSFSQQSKD